jgi:hypothetical protein
MDNSRMVESRQAAAHEGWRTDDDPRIRTKKGDSGRREIASACTPLLRRGFAVMGISRHERLARGGFVEDSSKEILVGNNER